MKQCLIESTKVVLLVQVKCVLKECLITLLETSVKEKQSRKYYLVTQNIMCYLQLTLIALSKDPART